MAALLSGVGQGRMDRSSAISYDGAARQHRVELNDLIARRLAEHHSDYWKQRLEESRIPDGFVNDYARALQDPQIAHRGLIRELEHPHSGTIRVGAPPWRMSRTHTDMKPPPLLGQHTAEILREWLGE